MTARSDTQALHERRPGAVLELDLDYCENVYGVSPCTAGRVNTGTLQLGGTTTVRLAAGASAVDDTYNGMTLRSTGGTGSGQERRIVDYVGATRDATVSSAFSPALDGTTTYDVINRPAGCYNVFAGESPCQDPANYAKGVKTIKFCERGMTIPPGELVRPYITSVKPTATEISTDKGLAKRSQTSVELTDEPCRDDLDKYVEDRAAAAGGTFWPRLLARNPNAAGRPGRLRRGYVAPNVLVLPGTSGNYASTPDSAALDITGDIDLRCKVALDDWTPANLSVMLSKYQAGVAADRQFAFNVDTDGTLSWVWSADGSSVVLVNSTASTGFANGTVHWVRVTMDVDNGAAGRDIKFYTSSDGESWAQLGTTVTQAGVTSIFSGTNAVRLGTEQSDASFRMAGKIYSAEVRNGINGPVVAAFRPQAFAPGAVTAVMPTGESWTVNQSGAPAARVDIDAIGFFDTFQTELFIIEALRGPAKQGGVTAVLADLVKLLDRTMIPAPTDGKLLADLPGVSDTGTARGGSLNTIVLREKASAVDDFYNGQEVFLLENTGAGQRRVISDYVGATRTATLAVNWQVVPDIASTYEVCPLEVEMAAGLGAQYPSPGAEPEFVRIGDEVIRYSAKSGDVLSWADGSFRAQFGTARADHKAKDAVQLCRAWIAKPFKTVAENILNEGGVVDDYIDLAQLAKEDTDWLGLGVITACIADPEKSSDLYADLLKDALMMSWWHPVEQKVKFKCDMPELGGASASLTDHELVLRETDAQRLDEERITRAAVDFDLVSATEDLKKRKNYRTIELFIDGTAEGPNSFNDVRQHLRQSRWFTEQNEILARANVARVLRRRGVAPWKVKLKLDPRNEVALGALVDLTTRKIPDAAGNAKLKRCRVARVVDQGGRLEAELRSTGFEKRYAFIAPNGQPNYGAASAAEREYAYISNGATMSDGSSAYLII